MADAPDALLACFVHGTQGVLPSVLLSLRREAEEARDMLFVRGTEACSGVSFTKWRAWWAEAARFLAGAPSVTHVGKCDDDTVVNVPSMLEAAP